MTADALTPPLSQVLAIDFECFYSDAHSVKTLGYWAYVHDPRFDAYLVSIYDVANERTLYTGSPDECDWSVCEGKVLVAHSSQFDQAVFDRLRAVGTVPADLQVTGWLCSMAASLYMQCAGSLKGAAKGVLGIEVDKEVRDMAKGKKGAVLLVDPDMLAYCARDAELCGLIYKKLDSWWPLKERQIWAATVAAGSLGGTLDMEHVTIEIAGLQAKMDDFASQIPWCVPGHVAKQKMTPGSDKALGDLCKLRGIPEPPSLDAKDQRFANWLQHDATTELATVVHAMKGYASHNRVMKIMQAMDRRLRPDGTIETSLIYCGATKTRRWSGRDVGFNTQNMNSKDDISDLRGAFRAAPQEMLGVIDLSQIEPRVLMWTIGNQDMLQRMAQGMSIYEAYARANKGWTGGKLKDEDPAMYSVMKVEVLAGGYGGGVPTFLRQAHRLGLPWVEADAAKAVAQYRSDNPGVVAFWKRLEDMLKECDGKNCVITLPSGNKLCYRDIRMTRGDRGWNIECEQVKGKGRGIVHGGLLCENWCSSVARDYYADRLVDLTLCGIKVMLLVHDEYVMRLPRATAQQELDFAQGIIDNVNHVPWAAGLPVASDAKLLERYGK